MRCALDPGTGEAAATAATAMLKIAKAPERMVEVDWAVAVRFLHDVEQHYRT